MKKDLLLVGSIPCNTVEEVFRTWGVTFAAHLEYMPDGEVGDRLHWIDGQAYRTFNGHPNIETLKRPAPDDGVERWKPRDFADEWEFKVKPGVKRVGFGDRGWRLGYARDAISSYFVFKTLKKEGVLPSDLRFMVALPTPESATSYTSVTRHSTTRSSRHTKRRCSRRWLQLSNISRRPTLLSSGMRRSKLVMARSGCPGWARSLKNVLSATWISSRG